MDTGRRVLIVCCCFFIGCSQSSTPSPSVTTTAPSQDDWQPFRSIEGRFSILMPGKAVDVTVDPTAQTFGVQLDGEVEYFVGWSDHADAVAKLGTDGVFRAATDGQTEGSQILENRVMTVLGKPARQVVSVDAENDVLHCQMVLAGNRLYQVGFLAPKGKYSSTGSDLAKFLESFQLTE